VDTRDAVALLATAIHARGGIWADLGAGEGVFTRALAEILGADARIYAVDRDARAMASLKRWASSSTTYVIPVAADITKPLDLPGLGERKLDGILLANALHFVRDAGAVLGPLARLVASGGSVVLIEYDHRAANQWVPYPIPSTKLSALAAAAGLSSFHVTATRASDYGGELYVAVATNGGVSTSGQ
jgi:ubiquinone/menaquinone biosynthesis C-methylase UbiE